MTVRPGTAASSGAVDARLLPPGHAEQAGRDALRAAGTAGVEVREISSVDEIDAVVALYGRVWDRGATPALSTELMRALAKAGNYVVGAFDDGRLIGACVGFFSAPADGALHSHIAGVSAEVRGRDVGFALKLHQRAWALRQGVPLVSWTFDPLVRRNAYFNVVKLAGRPVEYLPDFYGGMTDGINDGDASDRLFVRWPLTAPEVVRACAGSRRPGGSAAAERARGAVVALGVSAHGEPVTGELAGAVSLVAVPPDVEALRRSDPLLARRWRAQVREVLTELMGDGGVITDVDRDGWYVVRRQGATPTTDDEGQEHPRWS